MLYFLVLLYVHTQAPYYEDPCGIYQGREASTETMYAASKKYVLMSCSNDVRERRESDLERDIKDTNLALTVPHDSLQDLKRSDWISRST